VTEAKKKHIGLKPKRTARRYASVIWNSGKCHSVKWNETRRIGAIFACFCVARVCQRQLGFIVTFESSKMLNIDSVADSADCCS